jgi:predicted aconitase
VRRNQLGGQIGTDPIFALSTQTGLSPGGVGRAGACSEIKLTCEERRILDGKEEAVLQKVLASVVDYGELFGATHLVELGGAPHHAFSWGSEGVEPLVQVYRKLVEAGLKTYRSFTTDPKPLDPSHLSVDADEQVALDRIYNRMDELQELNLQLGMRSELDWSCACYLPEMGNTPQFGDLLAWSESSAVTYVNSVIGARTNRNPIAVAMLCSILGKAPYFGLLTDEGRRATWRVDVKTSTSPHPQILGSAIGLAAEEQVPYIVGLERFVPEINESTSGYLKDLGAAIAGNGGAGLFHLEGVTPEAIASRRDLLTEGYRTYVIDDVELDRVYTNYTNLWKAKHGVPRRVFLGCPHLTLGQMTDWARRIVAAMEKAGRSRIGIPTYLFGSPYVKDAFEKKNPEVAQKLTDYGVSIPANCPMMWCSTPIDDAQLVATDANKSRVYTSSRFFYDDVLIDLIVTGELPETLRSKGK